MTTYKLWTVVEVIEDDGEITELDDAYVIGEFDTEPEARAIEAELRARAEEIIPRLPELLKEGS